MFEKRFTLKNQIEKIQQNDELLEIIIKYDLSIMQQIILNNVFNVYFDSECVNFIRTRKINWIDNEVTVIFDMVNPDTGNIYSESSKKFSYQLKLLKDEVEITRHVPDKSNILYEIYEYLKNPKTENNLDVFLEHFCNSHSIEFSKRNLNYLKKTVKRFTIQSLDKKYFIVPEIVFEKRDELGFYTHSMIEEIRRDGSVIHQENFIVFHVGGSIKKAVEVFVYLSKYGMTKFLLQSCFVQTKIFSSDASLRRALSELRKHKITDKIYKKHNYYKIKVNYHYLVQKIQENERRNGSWILQIEKYSPLKTHREKGDDVNPKFNKIYSIIKKIEEKGTNWIEINNHNKYGAIDRFLLNISFISRKYNEAGDLIDRFYEDKISLDKKQKKFIAISSPAGFIIHSRDFQNNFQAYVNHSDYFTWVNKFIKNQLRDRFYVIKSKQGSKDHEEGMKQIINWYNEQPNITHVSGQYTCNRSKNPLHVEVINDWGGLDRIEIDGWVKCTEQLSSGSIKILHLFKLMSERCTNEDIRKMRLAPKNKTFWWTKKGIRAHGYEILSTIIVNQKIRVEDPKGVSIKEWKDFNYESKPFDDSFELDNLDVMCNKVNQKFKRKDYSVEKINDVADFIQRDTIAEEKVNGYCAVVITDSNGEIITTKVHRQDTDTVELVQGAGAKKNKKTRLQTPKIFKLSENHKKQFKRYPNSTFKIEIIFRHPKIKQRASEQFKKQGFASLDEIDPRINDCLIVVTDLYRFNGEDYTDPNFASAVSRRNKLESLFPLLTNDIFLKDNFPICIPRALKLTNDEASLKALEEFSDNIKRSGLYPKIVEGIVLKTNYNLRMTTCGNSFIKIKELTSIDYDLLIYAIRKLKSNNFQANFVALNENGQYIPIANMVVKKQYLLGATNVLDENEAISEEILNNLEDWRVIKDFNIILALQFRPAVSSNSIGMAKYSQSRVIGTTVFSKSRKGFNETNIDLISKITESKWVPQEAAKKAFTKSNHLLKLGRSIHD